MIKVIDSICGKGKTTSMINMMNENPQESYLYITPYIDEVKRVSSLVNNLYEVKDYGNGKRESLEALVSAGCNASATHELFRQCGNDIKELFVAKNYTLILDEVMDVVETLNLSKKDIESILDRYVEVDKDGNIKETKLDNADVGKLVSWNEILAKDEKSVYRYGEKIDYIDAVSFNGDGIGYGKDKNNWYYGVTKIKNADYKSFKEIKGSLTIAKDKYNVFYKEKIIEGADKKTFEPMEGKFSKDKFGFFYKEQRLEGVSYEDIKDLMKASRIDDKKVPGYKYKE